MYLPNKVDSHPIDLSNIALSAPQASLSDLIDLYAEKYEIDKNILHKVIKCESGYKINAVGDGGNSFGLVQIHLPSHPEITKEQALDKFFAIDYLARKISEGKGKMWTCFRMIKVV